MRIRLIIACALACFLGVLPGSADAADAGSLEVAGHVAKGAPAEFDLAALKALGTVKFQTHTPWTDGPQEFEAIPGDRLMKAVGAYGGAIDATAIDGYTTTIPFEDFRSGKAYIAISMNGDPLPADRFGPFWVIYQYDKDPQLTDKAHKDRSIWQLKSLIVK
jgi:hypothetical protein